MINYIGKHSTTFDVSEHTHLYWEIIYCTHGGGTISEKNGQKLSYEVHDIVVIPPNILHSNSSKIGFANLNFTIEGYNPLFEAITIFHDSENFDLYKLISQAHNFFHSKLENKNNIISLLSELIMILIKSFVGENFSSSYTQKIANSIISNFTDPTFTIDNCLKEIPMNKDYLRKNFTREKGISPLQFLTEKRISCAKKLLLAKQENKLSIKEISENSGFSDQLYFSRIFKKATGMSPNNYKPQYFANNKKSL